MWTTIIAGLQNVCSSTTSLKAKKIINLFGTTRYPVQNVWIWMIMLFSCVTSSSKESLEVFLDFYKLSGFDVYPKLVTTIERIVVIQHSYNCFDVVIGLVSVKDVWFSFRKQKYYVPKNDKFVTKLDVITPLIKYDFYLNTTLQNENIAWLRCWVNNYYYCSNYEQTQSKARASRFIAKGCDYYKKSTDDIIYSQVYDDFNKCFLA
jgi:hypothetical protein